MSAPDVEQVISPRPSRMAPLLVAVVAAGMGVAFGLTVPPAPKGDEAAANEHGPGEHGEGEQTGHGEGEKGGGHGEGGKSGGQGEKDGKTPAGTLSDPINLPEMIVNLAHSHGQRYLKVSCAVRLRAKEEAAAKERLTKRAPELRDGLITLLSSKTLEEVERPEAKEGVKLALLDLINREAFPDQLARAERLYFLEFIIQ